MESFKKKTMGLHSLWTSNAQSHHKSNQLAHSQLLTYQTWARHSDGQALEDPPISFDCVG